MKYVVDRVEGSIVVAQELDSKKMINIDKSLIDFDITDGMVINYKDGIYSYDEEETRLKREEINKRFSNLKE